MQKAPFHSVAQMLRWHKAAKGSHTAFGLTSNFPKGERVQRSYRNVMEDKRLQRAFLIGDIDAALLGLDEKKRALLFATDPQAFGLKNKRQLQKKQARLRRSLHDYFVKRGLVGVDE